MSDTYSTNRMSDNSRVLFERGKFFIETGTGSSFIRFWKNQQRHHIIRRIPEYILKRVADLIDGGDTTKAVTLWMKACENADMIPRRTQVVAAGILVRIALAAMTIYSFIYIMTTAGN